MGNSAQASQVSWDYTEHASHYDKRADYSQRAVDELLAATGCAPGSKVADIGAGTGKMSKELLKRGLAVRSVEPNDAMRKIGIDNTREWSANWSAGTGEATGLATRSVQAVFFGSSFNVVNQQLALTEAARILTPNGWFACLWNHRNLDDPIQADIESVIRSSISGYSYGSRREDPSRVIEDSGYFSAVKRLERGFSWPMTRADIIVAWRSHATLRRQAGSDSLFETIIGKISSRLQSIPEPIGVPYVTRAYFAQLTKSAKHA